MLADSLDRLTASIPDDAVVLDIGGWGKPLTRADWVMDVMPYDTRGLYGRDGEGEERFSRDTWIRWDICARDPFPFEDNSIDFVVCSHTLEDVRDPIWVCAEMNRIARAGYIEVPSRLEEQSYGIQGPWVGWGHHRWLVDIEGDRIAFVLKHHVLHGRSSDHFPTEFWRDLSETARVQSLWWRGAFHFEERIFTEPHELDEYLASFVRRHLEEWGGGRQVASGPRRRLINLRDALRARVR